jgi:nitroimidazol reductase NimA-like FMN-containing flavoprotein (pyridoxamine 5'-phosphate oxidase superfamily)
MNEPRDLPYATCRALLAGGVVGRVALATPAGPRIFPVNYSAVDEAVVFRTAPYSVLGTYAWRSALAFEVDHLDYGYQRGWSVVATGHGQRVEDPATREVPTVVPLSQAISRG